MSLKQDIEQRRTEQPNIWRFVRWLLRGAKLQRWNPPRAAPDDGSRTKVTHAITRGRDAAKRTN